jgi:four helix bundle protein
MSIDKSAWLMRSGFRMANRLEDLPIYAHAVKFCDATNAILQRPALRRSRKLWNQLAEANDSILANMKEGFEQSSDDAFANMLTYSKGSCAEVVSRTFQAHRRRFVTAEEYAEHRDMGEQLQRMMGGFINYLRRSGFKDRGSYRATHPDGTPPKGPKRRAGPAPPTDPAPKRRPSNSEEPPPVA